MKRFHLLFILAAAAAVFSCTKPETKPDDNPDNPSTPVTPASSFDKASEWSVIGTIGGDSWSKDIAMKTDGSWHAAFNVTVTASDEFKFRKNKNWDVNLGASSVKVGEKVSLSQGGDNIKLPAGTYDLYIAETNQIGYFLTAGSAFTHSDEAKVEEGGDLLGDYSASLAPSDKKSGITYQLNVYSFADSDGDGWGDFQGIIDHLDYLDAIGATALWLSPVNDSQSYHAYDIKDYYAINPKYGGKGATAAQAESKLKELITEAGKKNIDIYIDYVLNHSGDQCGWFKSALAGDEKYKDYYVFSDNYTADVAAGKVDNFAGQKDGRMGEWHSVAMGNPAYTGSKNLHFKLDVTSASAPKLTITETSDAAQADGDAGWYIFDNNAHQMRKTSTDKVYELTLKVDNNWGVLVKDHATEWGDHKWGAPASNPKITFGTPMTLVKGNAANDIIFGGSVTFYWGSFSGSMPDLNYGPWQSCETSAAFKDLAASADKWINLGVNGLRLDAVMWIYQCHTDANVKFLSEWYNHCNATYKARGGKGDFYMVGEAYDFNADVVAPYYKGLPSLFDFAYYGTVKDRVNKGQGSDLASTISGIQNKNKNAYGQALHSHRTGFEDAIKLSNHDENRVASEIGNHPQKKRVIAAILLTSPGKPYIYQGEELGYWGVKSSGDQNVRQPINWKKDCVVPTSWCSFDKSVITADSSVEAQAQDNRSLLQLYRHFAYARNTHSALAEGEMESTSAGNGAVAAWYMKSASEKVLVMHNLSSSPVTVTRDGDKLDKVIVANQKVEVSGKSVTLPAYSSVVFQQ